MLQLSKFNFIVNQDHTLGEAQLDLCLLDCGFAALPFYLTGNYLRINMICTDYPVCECIDSGTSKTKTDKIKQLLENR